MQYKRIQQWIEWQTENMVYKSFIHFLTACQNVGEIKENGYRMLKHVNYGFEEHRNHVTVLNLLGGSIAPLDSLWNERWKKPFRPCELSPLKAGRNQLIV